jgi:hypothetical protein
MKVHSLFRTVAIAAAFTCVAPMASAQALLTAAPVSVTVNLTSQCKWATSAPAGLAVDFGTYTAFQVAAKAPATPQTFTVECTRNFGTTPTVAWDGGTNLGVVGGLQYSLAVNAGTPTPGTAASTTSTGSGDQIIFTLTGSIPGGQAGDASGGADNRQLTLTF